MIQLDASLWHRSILGLALLTCVVGAVYAFVTPAGLPYDEPSHWVTVRYYADVARMPVLGQEGVTYEAQMGPVSYTADAIVVRVATVLGLGDEVAFRLVRLFGVLQMAACVLVIGALAKRLIPVSLASLAAVAVIALNPMLLTMSGSVQNDSLALLLGLVVLMLAFDLLRDRPRVGSALMVGGLAGLAVLTKLTDWVVVVGISAWLVGIHRRMALWPLAAFLGAAAAVSGWWFVRNIALYGDPSAASAVKRSGVSFDRYHIHGPAGVLHVVEQVVTYLWLPTEYVRNLISAPTALKGALLLVTVVAIAYGSTRLGRADRRALAVIGGTGVASVAVWLVTYLAYQSVAPRVAYLALPLWVMIVGLAGTRFRETVVLPLTVGLLGTLNIWCIIELATVGGPKFLY